MSLELAYRMQPNDLPRRGFRLVHWSGKPYAVRKGYRLITCEGACKNPFSDHCLSCAPLWGVKVVPDE